MAPRWKGKDAEAKALAEPMFGLISRLQSSLIEFDSRGILTGCNVLLAVNPEQADLLNRGCFGRPMITTAEKQWYQLSLEEASYLSYVLRCIKIVGKDLVTKIPDYEVWQYMTTAMMDFPLLFKAYAHLRMKNWVVRPGSQFGVVFVAYRHHPALVHSEFAVLVLSDEEDGYRNDRLRSWSDFHCTLRLCGSVAKTLLVLYIGRNRNASQSVSPWCLDNYYVEERIITRWSPEQSREDQTLAQK